MYCIDRAGDINLFFSDFLDEGDAEIDVMVPEPASRRKGVATEAIKMMMEYGRNLLNVSRFVAKISSENEASLALFRKLGYECEEFVEAFQEYKMVSPSS